MERACEQALAHVPGLRGRDRPPLVVDVMTRTGPAPATELARRIGAATAPPCEVTTIGGNTPQWLVNRASSDIAAGRLSVTLIAGAEAIRSSRARRSAGLPRDDGVTDLAPDPVVGDDLPGVGPAEIGHRPAGPGPRLPAVRERGGVAGRARRRRTPPGHGAAVGPVHRGGRRPSLSPGSPTARTAAEIATPSPDNRIVCEPYTKLMTAFLGSDQGAALVVCSLAAARRAGVADRAVFVWSGAEADRRAVPGRPTRSRPVTGHRRRRAGAVRGGHLGGRGPAAAVGVDDLDLLDLYSCFPSAVELATEALGLAGDDRRGLTVTGGLPYFGGPGNNYTTHGIATMTDLLREGGSVGGSARLGLATGLGWFITKHALGLYGSAPPPGGFHRGDTAAAQARIDGSAVETALELDEADRGHRRGRHRGQGQRAAPPPPPR